MLAEGNTSTKLYVATVPVPSGVFGRARLIGAEAQ